MNKVEDFVSAKQVLDEMRQEGIKPDKVTYSTLMNKVEDFDSAKQVLDEMKQNDIKPNLITYSTLFSKYCSKQSIRSIHLWYVQENEFHPSGALEGLIKNLYYSCNYRDAFYLILHYPHLTISKKILSLSIADSINKLDEFSKENYYLDHISYAKGIAYYVNSLAEKSNFYLKLIDKNILTSEKRKDIENMIEQNEKYI